ncbi:TIGR04348 family glycosyltransferase [Rubrobacter marinus]|uniref:TIGR04348 family glycosyltransferase n=1 Tax=Rubrobacter marinus TaxID=2653852 RepID=A0A6G8PYJ2_9ACTN|nr:selenoneine biosynthesis selenosugar synthase SenB [Rubrobacter marinus]QIN79281.1 TIGR04348 family glycosyltransferase [Rubrobacter marinus]
MKITVVTPRGPRTRSGNGTTAARWARLLRETGHRVRVEEDWSGGQADLMIALHARRSHPSIERFGAAHPDKPLVVALTGTDLYRDIRTDEDARESLELATRLILLQEKGLEELEPRHGAKARVVYQSAEPMARKQPVESRFDACVIGNLRAEKDPFRAALAARLLPHSSRLRVLHAGEAYDAHLAARARRLEAEIPRYRWIGEVPRWRARRLLGRSRLLVQSSLMEGGANVVSEALAAGVPVLASRIPGNVGMLDEDYPGYFTPGDEEALAEKLGRAEGDEAFYSSLVKGCAARAYLVEPERERAALAALVEELGRGAG